MEMKQLTTRDYFVSEDELKAALKLEGDTIVQVVFHVTFKPEEKKSNILRIRTEG